LPLVNKMKNVILSIVVGAPLSFILGSSLGYNSVNLADARKADLSASVKLVEARCKKEFGGYKTFQTLNELDKETACKTAGYFSLIF
jgi:hypothetical protein